MNLCILHRNAELMYQIKGVIAADAGQIEVFGENQHQQDAQRVGNGTFWQRFQQRRALRLPFGCPVLMLIPLADLQQHHDRQQRRQREPGDVARLP